jgi:hypothetical protein
MIHLYGLDDYVVSSVFRSRERQNVLDEVSEALRLFVDDAERTLSFLIRPELAVPKQLGEESNLRQRSSKLVRHSGDEVNAKLRKLLLASELYDCRAHETDGENEQARQHRQTRARQPPNDQA